jgi:O-succinylbenzoate synthase
LKFASISVHRLNLELRAPFTTSFGSYASFERPFVVIETVDGRRGIGEAPVLSDPAYKPEADPPSVFTSLRSFILPSVAKAHGEQSGIGSADDLRASYGWIKGAVFAKSAVEAAYWDLLAQEREVALWRLWGGERREFPVGVSIGGKTIEQVLNRADEAVAHGFKRLKVKIWPGFDVEPARALRERFPEVMLQVDANSAYDLSNWRALKGLDNLGLLLIEQPLYDDDIVEHSQIAREFTTPICLDESIHSLRDAQAAMLLWERNGILDRLIINIKPPRVSGFAEAIAIAEACQARGVKTWIGGMLDSAWGKAFNLNFNALCEIDLPGDHFSPTGPYFKDDVIVGSLTTADGVFTLGEGVSTGVEFDWERFSSASELLFRQEM